MDIELNSINDFYNFLDSISPLEDSIKSIPYKFSYLLDKISAEEKLNLETEFFVLKIGIKKSKVKHLQYGQEECDISLTDAQIGYLKLRIKTCKNPRFLSRYGHVLWSVAQDYESAQKAVLEDLNLVDLCIDYDTKNPDQHYGLHTLDNFMNAFYLSLMIDYNREVIKKKLVDLIKTFPPNSSSLDVSRLNLIELMIDNRRRFTTDEFIGLQEICYNMAMKYESQLFTPAFLDLGKKIDTIRQEITYEWDLEKAKYFEFLMEQSEKSNKDIVSPSYCREAINIYKSLGMNSKVSELEKKYIFLAKNQKLSEIETEGIDISKLIKQGEGIAHKYSSENIIKFLSFGNNIPNYEKIKSLTENLLQNSLIGLVSVRIVDDEGHIVKYLNGDKESLNYHIFQYYAVQMGVHQEFLRALIETAVKQKKLNADILIEYLQENTWYGNTLMKETTSKPIEYKWLDFFEPSIRSYFDKMEKALLEDYKVYPVFIQEIDSITLKIEGIIRDLIDFAKIEGFSTIKFKKDEEGREIVQRRDINNLLWDPNIFQILLPDDVWFLRYFLIEHINLRNEVAHCLFVTPKKYQLGLFHQLLIIILRLSIFKITPVIEESESIEGI